MMTDVRAITAILIKNKQREGLHSACILIWGQQNSREL